MTASRNYSSTAVDTSLSTGVNSSALSMQVAATTGFPAAPFILCIEPETVSRELVLVTNVAGTTLTVSRGYDSSSAVSHSAGAAVTHSHAAVDFRDSRTHESASTGVHGATGALVGTSDTQALTNKDLSSGTNSFPSSLATLTGTQSLTNKNLTGAGNTFPSSLATLTGAQALTNKDLSSGTNVFPAALATDAEVAAASAIAGPLGTVVMYAAAGPPSGWLVCDGSAVSRTTYAALFALLGSTYGNGNGSTTFNLPNFTGKMPRGGTPGGTGGSDTATLVAGNLPPHTHTIPFNSTTVDGQPNYGLFAGSASYAGRAIVSAVTPVASSSGPGSSDPVTVTNPYLLMKFIIRAA